MTTPFSLIFLGEIVLLLLVTGPGYAQLSPSFYSKTCPQFGSIVRGFVRRAMSRDAGMGASLLRLHFHDCFVNGCDGSILLDDTATFIGEKMATPNRNSLRGFDVIDKIKAQLESVCPGVVSCADINAIAARESVVALKGPNWRLALGRRDSITASFFDAEKDLPKEYSDLNQLISTFSGKGFTTREMVALSGSHSIGKARCLAFRDRIYNETNTTNSGFARSLQVECPRKGGDNNLAPLDIGTPDIFDNSYFRNLQKQRGLLHSDQALITSIPTAAQVHHYATNLTAFFDDFAAVMVKMSNLSPLTGSQGQIRRNCRRIN